MGFSLFRDALVEATGTGNSLSLGNERGRAVFRRWRGCVAPLLPSGKSTDGAVRSRHRIPLTNNGNWLCHWASRAQSPRLSRAASPHV